MGYLLRSSSPFEGLIELKVIVEVREFDPEMIPELRVLVESILAEKIGDETFSSFILPPNKFSSRSREPGRISLRVLRTL
jgi:hypothetical protein